MDKERQLQRYRRKDYTEIVEFPVEIVGRDGVVRRYAFEESIRLYQRRMSFASARFVDEALVDAELGHCRARIEQLRRSFFHQHGWAERQGERGFESAHPQAAGEVAAFLLRVLGEGERADVRFTDLGRDDDAEVWHVGRGPERPGLLMHAWFFGTGGSVEGSSFWHRLRALEALGTSRGDGERLVAWHSSADCAFLLTGRAEEVDGVVAGVREAPDRGAPEATPFDVAADHARRGDLLGAAVRCRSIVEAQPWHRDAYVLGAAVFLMLDRPVEAEDLAFVAAGYLPDDPLVHQYLGLARLRQGRARQAEASFARAVVLTPERAGARTLQVVAMLRQRRPLAALRAARLPVGVREDAELEAHRRIASVLRALAVVAAGPAIGAFLLAVLLRPGGTHAGSLAVAVVGLALAVLVLLGRRLRAATARALDDDVHLVLQRLRRPRRQDAVAG